MSSFAKNLHLARTVLAAFSFRDFFCSAHAKRGDAPLAPHGSDDLSALSSLVSLPNFRPGGEQYVVVRAVLP